MRVSYRWLCELVPGLEATPAEIAERLTRAGLEVEAVLPFGAPDPVVIARIAGVEAHPTRDKLKLVSVERGAGVIQRVVCGASNVPAPGGLVALAPLGTELPAAGITLTPREIGGIVSEGMLCSEKELGLADASDGILILPDGAGAPGDRLASALPETADTILEISVTPNRPDALSHIGVARDLAALFGLELQMPDVAAPRRVADATLEDMVSVDNHDLERCPHYGAAAVLDVKVAPSPAWLRYRLQSLGVRPISNVVDVTNLILFEAGQPMHAFDLDRVRDARIVIRRAAEGEAFTTLDGVSRTLEPDDLVIADGRGPSALAGVMGGEDSEIRGSTRRVLLECAYFSPRGIRRTSRRHGLSTDSSYRFERGVDFGAIPRVLERAASLLTELAGGARVPGAIHAKRADLDVPSVRLRSRRLDALLGVHVPFDEATRALDRLGLHVTDVTDEGDDRVAIVRGATFRPDIKREADLIEEVARLRGLETIPTVLPAIVPQPPRTSGRLERELRRVAAGLGLSEALTYSFVSRRELEAIAAPAPVVELANPLSEERSVMRTSLLPGLLEALRRARRRGERGVRLFTIGSLFLAPSRQPRTGAALAARPEMAADLGTLPEERPAFAALLAGPRPGYLARAEVDIYDAKGVAVEVVERLCGHPARLELVVNAPGMRHLHPRAAAAILSGTHQLGRLGPLHPDVIDALDLDGAAFVIELDLAALEELPRRVPKFCPIPRLPAVVRDISLEVSEELTAGELASELAGAAGELCESVELIDVFVGKPVPEGQRSLTFRLTYRDPKAAIDPENARTLTDKEVDDRHKRVQQSAAAIGARQRA